MVIWQHSVRWVSLCTIRRYGLSLKESQAAPHLLATDRYPASLVLLYTLYIPPTDTRDIQHNAYSDYSIS